MPIVQSRLARVSPVLAGRRTITNSSLLLSPVDRNEPPLTHKRSQGRSLHDLVTAKSRSLACLGGLAFQLSSCCSSACPACVGRYSDLLLSVRRDEESKGLGSWNRFVERLPLHEVCRLFNDLLLKITALLCTVLIRAWWSDSLTLCSNFPFMRSLRSRTTCTIHHRRHR